MDRSTVVIGGGLAGLTAAYELKKLDHQVTLLEAKDRVGGVVFSANKDGYLIEYGPNTIRKADPELALLIDELGLNKDIIYSEQISKVRYIVKRKKIVALPTSPISLIRNPVFSIDAKLRILREPFIKARHCRQESVTQFIKRRLGREILEFAVNPFVAGIYAGDPDLLSVQHAFPKLYELERKHGSLIKGQIAQAKENKRKNIVIKRGIFSFTNGMYTLPLRFAEKLGKSIKTQCQAVNISKKDKQWQVTYLDKQKEIQQILADNIIYAAPTYTLKNLTFNNKHHPLLQNISNIPYPPMTVVILGFRRSDIRHPLAGFGFLVPKVEKRQILGCLFSSSLFPNRAPEDHVCFTVFVGGARQPENALLPEDKLLQLVIKDLTPLLGVTGNPSFVHHIHWPRAIPQYNVDYQNYLEQMQLLEQNKNLYFIGNYRRGISVVDTVLNARKVAKQIK